MFDTAITMCGNVLTAPEWRRTSNTGTYVMTFRFASTSRRFDRNTNQWVDGDSLRVRVACWRTLGQNASESIQLGDPLVIYGRLYSRDWVDSDNQKRTSYELDAISLGHDISRGVSHFARRKPVGATDSIEDAESAAAIGGESSEHVEAPQLPPGMPSASELVGEFDSNRFEARSFMPEDDDESDYGRGAMGRGRSDSADGDSADGDAGDGDGANGESDDEVDEIESELSVAA